MKTANLLVTALSLIHFLGTAHAAAPQESLLKIQGMVFSMFQNQAFNKTNASIEEAIIVVHGSERNAITYYNSVTSVAQQLGKENKVLIIAPHFKEPGDTMLSNELKWTSEGWLRGDEAINRPGFSSFILMDHIIKKISNPELFPHLKMITITGHSAGGQLTQRYALGTQIDRKLPGIHFRFVPANPGSYTYLTPKRQVGQVSKVPSFTNCPDYNDYKYGLARRNPYMNQLSTNALTQQYISRDITYLVGEKDIISEGIDQYCAAHIQGVNRLERGKNFKANLDLEFPGNAHQFFVVPGIAHTQHGMYHSPIGIQALFH